LEHNILDVVLLLQYPVHFFRASASRLRFDSESQRGARISGGIGRASLYRALSVRGNPRLSTLVAVTKAIGLRLTVEAAQ
jgi:hypothetical protein